MGKRGPVPAPDNVRQLRGMKPLLNADGTRTKRLVLPPKAPAMPEGLNRRAAAEWRRVVKDLERAGVLAEIDRGVLTAYVTAWSYMMDAVDVIRKDGITHANREGVTVKSPAWQVYREANRTLILAASQLYLTPVARLRIPVPAGASVDDGSSDDLFD